MLRLVPEEPAHGHLKTPQEINLKIRPKIRTDLIFGRLFGRKLSEETRRKMSESHRISAQLESPEQRKKRGDAMRGKPGINRGKKFSQEVRLKMSNSHKLRYQNHECKNFV